MSEASANLGTARNCEGNTRRKELATKQPFSSGDRLKNTNAGWNSPDKQPISARMEPRDACGHRKVLEPQGFTTAGMLADVINWAHA